MAPEDPWKDSQITAAVPVRNPLPNVASHVLTTIRTRTRRITPHRSRLKPLVITASRRGVVVIPVVALLRVPHVPPGPHVRIAASPARSLLPLRLRRQMSTRPRSGLTGPRTSASPSGPSRRRGRRCPSCTSGRQTTGLPHPPTASATTGSRAGCRPSPRCCSRS